MSSLTVPKRGSAAQALAALNAEDAPTKADEQSPVLTDTRTNGHTEAQAGGNTDARTPALTEIQTDASEDGRQSVPPPTRQAARTDSPNPARKPARTTPRPAANADRGDAFVDKVKTRMASREPLEGGSKTTLEYSPEMSRRIKQYCLDKGKDMNGRVILTALLTTFLEEEGY